MTPEETAAIAGLCDASDLVEYHCPYCRETTETHYEHWRDNPPPHPGGYWRCAYRRSYVVSTTLTFP